MPSGQRSELVRYRVPAYMRASLAIFGIRKAMYGMRLVLPKALPESTTGILLNPVHFPQACVDEQLQNPMFVAARKGQHGN